jgi:hypothetical protein
VASSVAASPSSIRPLLHRSAASSPGSGHHPRSAPLDAGLCRHHPLAWTPLQDFDPALASPLGAERLCSFCLDPAVQQIGPHSCSSPAHRLRPSAPPDLAHLSSFSLDPAQIHLCLCHCYSFGRRRRHRCFSRCRRRFGRLDCGPLHLSGCCRRLP